MLTDHKQIDKRITMKNQNRSAVLERPAMKLPGQADWAGSHFSQTVISAGSKRSRTVSVEPYMRHSFRQEANICGLVIPCDAGS